MELAQMQLLTTKPEADLTQVLVHGQQGPGLIAEDPILATPIPIWQGVQPGQGQLHEAEELVQLL